MEENSKNLKTGELESQDIVKENTLTEEDCSEISGGIPAMIIDIDKIKKLAKK